MDRLKCITIIVLLVVTTLISVATTKTASVLLQEGLYTKESAQIAVSRVTCSDGYIVSDW
jgi:hypothetical protein